MSKPDGLPEHDGSNSALAGIVVADFSSVLAGPYMTMLLADLGATVIKVESPDGDGTRRWGPPWSDSESTYFHSVNRNKTSVQLDLGAEEDNALARKLIGRSDVLVENLRPGLMSRFGLGYDQLSQADPRLIYCSISGYGSQPAGARLPGYDMLAQAASGLMSITGPQGGPGYKTGVALVDILCGLHGAVGILSALSERQRSGRGQRVEVNLLLSALSALANQASSYLIAGVSPDSLGNAHPSVVPYDCFPTKDGNVIIAVGTDRQFARLCVALGLTDLGADPRFRRNHDRVANREELTQVLVDRLQRCTRDEVVSTLQSHCVPCGPVNRISEAFNYAHSIDLDATWVLDGKRYVRTPISLSRTAPRAYLPPPALGSSDEAIRRWLSS